MQRNASDKRDTMDPRLSKIGQRITRFTHRPAESVESKLREADYAKAVGLFWQDQRIKRAVPREDLADAMGMEEEDLIAFEGGFMSPQDLPPDFAAKIAHALGDDSLENEFKRKFPL